MSNHFHVVLFVDTESATNWSLEEVIVRWHRLFSGNLLSQRYLRGELLGKAQMAVLYKTVAIWRQRLTDISWFMRVLNESIARKANAEDNCSGRFWEGRFKSQALLDEAALAACMAYVDLNPIRAAMAKTLEDSHHTSIKQRIEKAKTAHQPNHYQQQPKYLYPFAGYLRQNMPKGLPFRLTEYLELVDWTGRAIRDDKRGSIDQRIPPILDRLAMETKHWLYLTQNFESPFKGLVGSAFKLKQACEKLGYHRSPGIKDCVIYFP